MGAADLPLLKSRHQDRILQQEVLWAAGPSLGLWSHTSPSQQQRDRKEGGSHSLSTQLVRGQAQKSGSGLARTVGGPCARATKELVLARPTL